MRRLFIWLCFFALAALLLPLNAEAKCRFACIAHKVTDLKALTLGLSAELEETNDRMDEQATVIESLRSRTVGLESWSVSFAGWTNAFFRCFGEVPISRYGEEQGPSGYVFQLQGEEQPSTLQTTALDVTYDPDPVGAWIWANTCNRERVTLSTSLLKGGSGAR